MLRLSRTAAYAIHATWELAQAPDKTPVPCGRLAAAGQMPERFLLQILRQLVNCGILKSSRGVAGGYQLAQNAADIRLLDLVEAVDGPLRATCPLNESFPAEARDRLQDMLSQLTEHARRELADLRLSQLLPKVPTPKK